MASPNFLANGTIQPSTFVMLDPSSNERVITCTANSAFPIGIAQQGVKYFPTPGSATNEAADAGDQIQVYGAGDVCLLSISTAGITTGQLITSNSLGQGVAASGSNICGAVALETLSGAGLARVQVTPALPY
jgi:hypothetical protein